MEFFKDANCDLRQKTGGTYKIFTLCFTEYGALTLSSILKSKVAIKVNNIIVKAFVDLRKQISADPSFNLLAERVRRIESEVKEIKSATLVEGRVLTDKVSKLSSQVNSFSRILDELQDAHLIIKRPDDVTGES